MALTYLWNTINASQCDADSPLDEILMEALRQNLIHNNEWLGKDYTPAENHNHDDVNSKLVYGLQDFAAGDVLIANVEVENSISQESDYTTEQQEIKISRGGTLRIKFDLKSGTGGTDAYGKIYRNGIAVGTEQINDTTSYITYSEDISGWSKGDLCQIYLHDFSGQSAFTRNFRLYSDIAINEQDLFNLA